MNTNSSKLTRIAILTLFASIVFLALGGGWLLPDASRASSQQGRGRRINVAPPAAAQIELTQVADRLRSSSASIRATGSAFAW